MENITKKRLFNSGDGNSSSGLSSVSVDGVTITGDGTPSNPLATTVISPLELDPVISQTNTPPGAPTTGDRYLVGTAPTGTWVGSANKIAEWDGATWQYTTPVTDNTVFITNTLTTKRFNGTLWVAYNGTAILQNGNSLGAAMTIGTSDNKNFQIKTNNTVRFRILNTGVVSVAGNSYFGNIAGTPTARVHIKGSTTDSSAYGFKVDDSTPTTLFSVRNDGEVNSLNGYWVNGLKFLHYGGTNNNDVFVGYQAGLSITSGQLNAILGSEALKTATTDHYNVAIGASALKNLNGSDGENIGIGYRAGESCSTGFLNMFLGTRSALTVTTGAANTFVGNYSSGITTGSYNTSLGYNTTYSSGTLSDCIVIGANAIGTASNQLIIGGTGHAIANAYIGTTVSQPDAKLFIGTLRLTTIQTGNSGLSTGDTYIDSAATITANGDKFVAYKV